MADLATFERLQQISLDQVPAPSEVDQPGAGA